MGLNVILKSSIAFYVILISHDDVAPGKYSRVALAEEEQCEDLLLFMRMLTHLTTKDFLDFGNCGEMGVSSAQPQTQGTGFCSCLGRGRSAMSVS